MVFETGVNEGRGLIDITFLGVIGIDIRVSGFGSFGQGMEI